VFFLLARKAGAAGWGDSVGPWLHAAAWRIARKARVAAARQRTREARVVPPTPADLLATVALRELSQVLDEELTRLSERLRAPLVLCYLEGRTRDEAAKQLGVSLGTLKDRLERGRALLRIRLTRRGVTLAVAGLPAVLAESVVSTATAAATAEAATTVVNGTAIPAAVAALMDCARPALGAKASVGLGLLLVASGLVVGMARLVAPAVPQGPPNPAKGIVSAGQRDPFNDPLPPGAVARFGTALLRHGDDIRGARFTPDGKYLVSWAWDGVRVWDTASGAQVRSFGGRRQTTPWQMNYAALSPDGASVAITFSNPRVEQAGQGSRHECSTEIWDVATGQMRHWFPTPPRFFVNPTFTPNGQMLAVASDGIPVGDDRHAVLVFDVATGRELHQFRGHADQVLGIVFLSSGREAITSSDDGSIRVWEVATGHEVRQFTKPLVPVGELSLSSDGRWLATIDRPKKQRGGYVIGEGSRPNDLSPIRLWDVATGREVRLFPGHNGGSQYLAFTPDGRRLLSGALDRLIREWDLATGRELRALPQAWCRGLALSPDGRTFADMGWYAIRLRDLANGADRVPVTAPNWGPDFMAQSSDGRTVATAGANEPAIYVWETGTGKLLRRLEGPTRDVYARGLVWSADGKTLLTAESGAGGKDHAFRQWDVEAGRERPRPPGFEKPFEMVLASPDGRRVMTFAQGPAAIVWDSATGRAIVEFAPRGLPFAMSTDGRKLLSVDEKVVQLWDLTAGQPPQCFSVETAVWAAAVSADGRWLAVASDSALVTLYETATGRAAQRINGLLPEEFSYLALRLALSADGRRLAIADRQGTLHIWDVAAGRKMHRLASHGNCDHILVFSPDGQRLADGDGDRGMVYVWDTGTGRKLHEFAGHRGGVSGLAFTPDGRRLISGSRDTTALVWDVSDLPPGGP
jgi:WD40 repeat protein